MKDDNFSFESCIILGLKWPNEKTCISQPYKRAIQTISLGISRLEQLYIPSSYQDLKPAVRFKSLIDKPKV